MRGKVLKLVTTLKTSGLVLQVLLEQLVEHRELRVHKELKVRRELRVLKALRGLV
jgi:hypothetical protein